MSIPDRSSSVRPICDYEGSGYEEEFWSGRGREYEDLAERIALSRLMPACGRRLLEIGAGFGRLADLYAGYDEVVLLDYSRSLLRRAAAARAGDPRLRFVAADLYDLPFIAGQFDAIVMVRVMHHLVDVPAALAQIRRVLAPDGRFVVEYANKRNVKAIARHALGRQAWSPWAHEPYEFVPLNFDFHPAWMERRLKEGGFVAERRLSVSHFRTPFLKRLVRPTWLARLDGAVQPTGALWTLSPSVMMRLRQAAPQTAGATAGMFRCLRCGHPLAEEPGAVICSACGAGWPVQDGIHDFKADGSAGVGRSAPAS